MVFWFVCSLVVDLLTAGVGFKVFVYVRGFDGFWICYCFFCLGFVGDYCFTLL